MNVSRFFIFLFENKNNWELKYNCLDKYLANILYYPKNFPLGRFYLSFYIKKQQGHIENEINRTCYRKWYFYLVSEKQCIKQIKNTQNNAYKQNN